MSEKAFYVYVYVDPRNFQEFYYGKGQGDRKEAHTTALSDSDKSRRIREIFDEGLQPIIRVISSNLSEEQAFLIEKTLIWKAHEEGRKIDNKATGNFSSNFRPHNVPRPFVEIVPFVIETSLSQYPLPEQGFFGIVPRHGMNLWELVVPIQSTQKARTDRHLPAKIQSKDVR